MKHNRRRSTGKPRVSPTVLDRINPNVAGIDCGAAEHFVAVPHSWGVRCGTSRRLASAGKSQNRLLERPIRQGDRRVALGRFVVEFDIQSSKGAVRLSQQEVQSLLGPADLVTDAVYVLADGVAVSLHLLEARELRLDSRLDVAQGGDVADVARGSTAHDECHPEENSRVEICVRGGVVLIPGYQDVASEARKSWKDVAGMRPRHHEHASGGVPVLARSIELVDRPLDGVASVVLRLELECLGHSWDTL
jgi:hypothetical protein